MTKDIIASITGSVRKAQNLEIMFDKIYESRDKKTKKNEFLFFVKPEITIKSDKIKLELIMEHILDKIETYGLSIHNITTLSGAYIDQYDLISQHYGIINSISSNASGNLSESAKIRFREIYGKSVDDVKILGSLELIEQYRNFHAYTIDYIWQNLDYRKLASGTYCAPIKMDNNIFYLFNGFHPRQIKHYTRKGSNIVVMTLSGDIPWSAARNDFVGATDPKNANKSSLRRDFMEKKADFGLGEITQSYNGVHLSAGPVEALIELKRFNSNYSVPDGTKGYSDYDFGKALLANFNSRFNDIVNDSIKIDVEGKATSVFDLTEEVDSDKAIELLKKYLS